MLKCLKISLFVLLTLFFTIQPMTGWAQEEQEYVAPPAIVVEAFIEDLGHRDFRDAFSVERVKSWGDYEAFSSTREFGAIDSTWIYAFGARKQNGKDAEVFADAYYHDPLNGSHRFRELFKLQKIDGKWYITGLKLLKNYRNIPENQIEQILSGINFFSGEEMDIEQGLNQHVIYRYSLDNQRELFLVFTRNQQYECHACGTVMSVFVFDKNAAMVHKFIRVDTVGAWGTQPDYGDIQLHGFGQAWLVSIEDGYSSGGVTETFKIFYFLQGDRFKRLGHITVYWDNSGTLDKEIVYWEAKKISYEQKSASTPPDIVLTVGKTVNDGPEEIFTERYTYNGSEYVKIK